MLVVVAFLTGAAVMAFEVLGFRVMAITFDSRDIVNGSLIAAVMTALSLGYYTGGTLADRWPRPALLGALIILAGAYIELVPMLKDWMYRSQLSNPDVTGMWGPLAGALVLFGPSSFVFGMTSPFVIRVSAPSPEVLGRLAGKIYAISTLGSIFGTLFTTFYLIQWVGTTIALQIVGGASVITGLLPIVWSFIAKKRGAAGATTLAFVLVGGVATVAHAKLLYKRDSTYHQIEVHEEVLRGRTIRKLRFDNSDQSAVDLNDPDAPMWLYTDYMHLSFAFKPEQKRVCVLGLGGGTIPMRLYRDHRDLKIDVAELDPVIEQVAKQFFNVKEDERLKITVTDGRQFLRRTENVYDAIYMDAYHGGRYGPTLPFPLCTKEFMEIVHKRLADDGVLAFNLIGTLGNNDELTRSILKTLQSVFPRVYLFPVDFKDYPDLTDMRNIVVIGTKDSKEVSAATIKARAQKLIADRKVTQRNFLDAATDLYTRELNYSSVRVLTDDNAQPDRLLQPGDIKSLRR